MTSSINSYINSSNFSNTVRNRWTNQNLGETVELKGSLFKRSYNDNTKSTKGNWENLLNKSFEIIRSIKRSE